MAAQSSTVVVDEATIASFKAQLRGELIQPGDAAYDEARKVYNGMFDKRPRFIARCVDVADVISCVNFAREGGLLVAVRGGGQSAPGLGTCDGGLVIDLSPMDGVHVDPVEKTVRAEGGCVWGDVDHATHPFGLATPSGFISTTGVGGLTLGGGIGYLARAYGLTVDNLLSVDMVLADGSFVTANAEQHPDLYWAVRGGGGNFGVVTSFQFRCHDVGTVYGGPIFWPLDQAKQVLTFWRDFILGAPRDINGWFGFVAIPPAPPFPEQYHGQTMCVIVWCYTGDMDQAAARFEPIRAVGTPAMDLAGPVPWPALQSLFDALFPPGLQWYWKADFITDLSDQAIDLLVKYGGQLPTPYSTMHLYPVNGAVHDASPDAMAFNYRDANFSEVIVGVDPDPANNERMIEWARNYWLALHPYSAGGGYINMMMGEGSDQVRASYRANYDRLAQIKARYDPHNLFRVNQNIEPAK